MDTVIINEDVEDTPSSSKQLLDRDRPTTAPGAPAAAAAAAAAAKHADEDMDVINQTLLEHLHKAIDDSLDTNALHDLVSDLLTLKSASDITALHLRNRENSAVQTIADMTTLKSASTLLETINNRRSHRFHQNNKRLHQSDPMRWDK